jgi:hypothetical protein
MSNEIATLIDRLRPNRCGHNAQKSILECPECLVLVLTEAQQQQVVGLIGMLKEIVEQWPELCHYCPDGEEKRAYYSSLRKEADEEELLWACEQHAHEVLPKPIAQFEIVAIHRAAVMLGLDK